VEFGEFGRMVAVRCPKELAHILKRAGGVWEPGSRRWLVERRRIGPVIRALEAATDPLFRETVARSPLFKEAFARRRCLVPAAAYYE
jgi:hypothetical protein